MEEHTYNPLTSTECVNKAVLSTTYKPNDLLKRLIFFKAKMNISQFAKSIGVSRQCIFGLIAGTHRASPNLAKRISDELGEEDTRVIFQDGSIKYPTTSNSQVEVEDE